MKVDLTKKPIRLSKPPAVKAPSKLEDVAFSSLTELGQLLKTRQVTSVALTEMYLNRLKRLNAKLNFVVSFTDELGIETGEAGGSEIAAGKISRTAARHSVGRKDIISVKGYKTTWGRGAFKDQSFELRRDGREAVARVPAPCLIREADDRRAGGGR